MSVFPSCQLGPAPGPLGRAAQRADSMFLRATWPQMCDGRGGGGDGVMERSWPGGSGGSICLRVSATSLLCSLSHSSQGVNVLSQV